MDIKRILTQNLANLELTYDVVDDPLTVDKSGGRLFIASDLATKAVFRIEKLSSDTDVEDIINNGNVDYKFVAGSQTHLTNAIATYASGKENAFANISVLLHGTDFQLNVWNILASLGYGEVISYSELAIKSGKPSAIRAVATACGKNPVPIIIPCHRIIAKNGGLGGFAWGLAYKRQLLEVENA